MQETTRITIKVAVQDIAKLEKAFANGQLAELGILEVQVPKEWQSSQRIFKEMEEQRNGCSGRGPRRTR